MVTIAAQNFTTRGGKMALKLLGLRNLASVLVLGGAVVGLTGGTALAQVAMGPSGILTSGKLEFRQYCAQCHGMSGVGNGPVAPSLKKKPANLTLLSKNNGGVFPEKEVRDYIDGTKTAAAHGTREMPIWGNAFRLRQASEGAGTGGAGLTEAQVNSKINMLVNYVKSIQVQ
jgi:mono/diheme cytochrome c family protein